MCCIVHIGIITRVLSCTYRDHNTSTRKCKHNTATKPYHNYIIYRSVEHFSDIEFLTDLSNQHWSLLTACADPDECTSLFIDMFSPILQKESKLRLVCNYFCHVYLPFCRYNLCYFKHIWRFIGIGSTVKYIC